VDLLLTLISEFTLLEELTEDADVVDATDLSADGPE
jgi:hypothetical protein